jgi:hypothetical protein
MSAGFLYKLDVPLTRGEEDELRVGLTPVSLDAVVYAYEAGASAEEIVQHYGSLCLRDVYAVLAFYHAEREEVERYLAPRGQRCEGVRQMKRCTFNHRGRHAFSVARPAFGRPARRRLADDAGERAVLATILIDPGAGLEAATARQLRPEDFLDERHRLVFAAMLDLHEEGMTIDLRNLQSRLEERGQTGLIGGLAYIAGLDLYAPDLTRIGEYIQSIQSRAEGRGPFRRAPAGSRYR